MKIIEQVGMIDSKPCTTPVDTSSKLSSDTSNHVSDPMHYRNLIDALKYLTFTRPNISYAVQQTCLHMHDPWETPMTALKCIMRYLHDTLNFGLLLRRSSTFEHVVYSDADWARCSDTRRSTFGFVVFLGDNLVSWSSNAEAGYQAVVNGVAETCWFRPLLMELDSPLSHITLIYCDNISGVYLASNPV
jgi:hypothetical protein